MKEITRGTLAIVRASAIALLTVAGLFAFSGETRIGFGLTPKLQDIAPSPPYVSPAPDKLDFGNQVVRRTSAAKRITVKNTGGKPLYIDSIELGGDNPNSFTIVKDTCTGATVDQNKACIVDVTFTPSGTGGRNARLRLNDNALDSPQRLRLKGNGINSNDVAPF